MSHFSVLVTKTNHTDVETQLAPFDENLSVPEYVRYTREQLIADERKSFEEYRASTYAEFLRDPSAYKAKYADKIRHLAYVELEFPKRFQWTDEDFYQEAIKEYEPEELTPLGGVKSTRNPQSKWDWWTIGGRWSGYLLTTLGSRVDTAVSHRVDWGGMKQESLRKAEARWSEYEAKVNEGKRVHAYFEYGIEKDDTRETYLARCSSASTFAVVHNGEWYEKGHMGWWGMVSGEKSPDDWFAQFQKILAELSPEDEITIVDCHI